MLRQIAPEYYDSLPQYGSWSKVLFDYIFRSDVSAWSRVKRTTLSEVERKDLHAREQTRHFSS